MISEADIRERFCKNLNIEIKKHGVTQREIADAIGVSYPTMNQWVKGKKVPRMDKIDKLCAFFQCSRSDLIEERKQAQQSSKQNTDNFLSLVLEDRPDIIKAIKSVSIDGKFTFDDVVGRLDETNIAILKKLIISAFEEAKQTGNPVSTIKF